MRDFSPNFYPFAYDVACGLSLAEVTHSWNDALPAVFAAIAGSEEACTPFEQALSLDVPLVLVYPHIKADGFCRIHLKHLDTHNGSRYIAELRCFPKSSPTIPYLELLSRSGVPELTFRHLTFSFASYLFAIESEIESVA